MVREKWIFGLLCVGLSVVLICGWQWRPGAVVLTQARSPMPAVVAGSGAYSGDNWREAFGAGREQRMNPFAPPWPAMLSFNGGTDVGGSGDSAGRAVGGGRVGDKAIPRRIVAWDPEAVRIERMAIFSVNLKPTGALLKLSDGMTVSVEVGSEFDAPAVAGSMSHVRVVAIETEAVVLAIGEGLVRVR